MDDLKGNAVKIKKALELEYTESVYEVIAVSDHNDKNNINMKEFENWAPAGTAGKDNYN